MEVLVVHSTKYGSTEKYALQIAKKLQCSAVKGVQVQVEDLMPYDVIILGSCLLEGELANADLYEKWVKTYPDKHWALFTVGLANPVLTDFSSILAKGFSPEVIEKLQLFHYRGAIQYKRLLLMQSLFEQARKDRIKSIDHVKLGPENRDLLSRYGTHYDSDEEGNIFSLIEWVKSFDEQIEEN